MKICQAILLFYAGLANLAQASFYKNVTDNYFKHKVLTVKNYIADLNNDGLNDLVILPSKFAVPHFYIFDPVVKKFIRKKNVLSKNLRANFLSFADLDNDGILDIILFTFNQGNSLRDSPLRFMKGDINATGITFNEVKSNTLHILKSSSSFAIFDYNLDGILDIFIGNAYDKKKSQLVPDILLEGSGKIQFKDVSYKLFNEWNYLKGSKQYPLATPTMSVSTCDINNDGFLDILTASTHGYQNKLWLNTLNKKGIRAFNNISKKMNYSADSNGRNELRGGGHSLVVLCNDYNNDQLMDVFVGEMKKISDGPKKDVSSILTGDGPSALKPFMRTPFLADDGKKITLKNKRALWFDVNSDGRLDLFIENETASSDKQFYFFLQMKDHAYVEMGRKLFATSDSMKVTASTFIDVNRDGHFELLLADINKKALIEKNNLKIFELADSPKNKFIKVKLQGIRANSLGVGAKLILNTNQGKQTRILEISGGNFPSQSEYGALFVIKKGNKVLSLSVTWPILDLAGKDVLKVLYSFDKNTFNKNYNEMILCENGKYFLNQKISLCE